VVSTCYSVDNGSAEYRQVATQSGGSIVIDGGAHVFSGITPGSAHGGETLDITLNNLPSSIRTIIAYVNNGTGMSAANGCFTLSDSAGSAAGLGSVAAGHGEFLQWNLELASGQHTADLVESTDACGTANATQGSVRVAGLFFLCSGPTIAAVSRLMVGPAHGGTVLRWYAAQRVVGFNVFDGTRRLNRHLVVSHTHWYRFWTPGRVSHPRVVAVR
jgi:hypothetical protein